MNTTGLIYRLTSFGESHGCAIGGVVDGVPAGVKLDIDAIQAFMARRRPGQSAITTQRNEQDQVEFLSGIFEGVTTGTPIGFIVRNNDSRSSDYDAMRHVFRPSHADYTYTAKYGHRDHRGGGRASARVTIGTCVAGAIALQILAQKGITIRAYTSQIGSIAMPHDYTSYDLTTIDSNAVRCPDSEVAEHMEKLINEVRSEGDSIGGIVTCVAQGVPAGWGEPIYDKLHADLGKAMLNINAAKGFEYGMGFAGATLRGSQVCDIFDTQEGRITTRTNHSGGIQGGISNGADIYFRVAFKPTPTLLQPIESITTNGETTTLTTNGRHDPCVVPRAIPLVEAASAMVLLDHYLRNKATQL
ncbi:MAG: chorismate synthase [Bacteroidales bacterium]|nr:chorismate synthase [Bacteroidales bacterium]